MNLVSISLLLFFLTTTQSKPIAQNSRIEELNAYWAKVKTITEAGDFDGMKSLYHLDAVLVKKDTTISIAEAFHFRWKDEIMKVKAGILKNTVNFRFSKRVGNHITAYEEGIFHYKSIDTETNKVLGDSYIHFDALMVKVDGTWVMTMEYQKEEATLAEWEALE